MSTEKSFYSSIALAGLVLASTHAMAQERQYIYRTYVPGVTAEDAELGTFTPLPRCITPWGQTIVHGDTVEGYSAPNVPWGESCSQVEATLSCDNKILIGEAVSDVCEPLPQDIDPDPFYFTPVAEAKLDRTHYSNLVQVNGIEGEVPVSFTFDEGITANYTVCLNVTSSGGCHRGRGYTTEDGYITNGQYIAVRMDSSKTDLDMNSAYITVGDYTASWDVMTGFQQLVTWNNSGRITSSDNELTFSNDFVDAAAGSGHYVALRNNGTLLTWGDSNKEAIWGSAPVDCCYVSVVASRSNAAAMRADGSFVVWGDDTYGQVSDAPTGSGFKKVALGGTFNVAIHEDGTLTPWGYDSTHSPVSTTPTDCCYIDVATDQSNNGHGVAIKTDGTMVGWGYRYYGQHQPRPGNNWVKVVTGRQFNVALNGDGTVTTWGYNLHNQVTDSPAGSDFVDVYAGEWYAIAKRADGSYVSWGRGQANSDIAETLAKGDFFKIDVGNLSYAVGLKRRP